MSDHLTNTDLVAAFEAELARGERHAAQSAQLWRMSAAERVAAMNAGRLSLDQLCEWSRRVPREVPRIGGEFAWIIWTTPEWVEAQQPASKQRS